MCWCNNCIVNHRVLTMTVWIAIIPCCVWRWFHLCVQPVDPQAVVCLLWVYVCPIPYKEHHHCLRTAAAMNCQQMLPHSHHPHERQSERRRDKRNKEIHMSHSTEGNVWIMFSLNLSCLSMITFSLERKTFALMHWDREAVKIMQGIRSQDGWDL